MKYDIITFGSASEDIFVFSKKFFNKKLCFSLGDKVEMDKILIHTGGGGTNTATTFALQGLKTAYCGSVGEDYAGFSVLLALKKFGIATEHLYNLKNKTTNHSVILSKKEEGRTILVYREASNFLPDNFSLKKLKANWFYIAPLGKNLAKKTKEIIEYAKSHNIKIALNPSKEQIKIIKKDLNSYLEKIDVLIINDIEKELLFGKKPLEKIIKEIDNFFNGILVTGNEKYINFSDGNYLYKIAIMKPKKISDKTGAGDALGSGLVAGLINNNNLEKAIQLAYANTTSCLKEWGAKEGLLKKGEGYEKVKINKKQL
jgi:sugar/nucleoside kinase (ribokinase family)